jgi:hypothetical protein
MTVIKAFVFCFLSMLLITCQKNGTTTQQTGTLKITFTNTVKGNPMLLFTSNYTNSFGEQYIITKFKYYISNIGISGPGAAASHNGYYLIDEGNISSLSFSFDVPVNTYTTINFLLGVDSARNVSGAQTGALDPLNDMFWTWNSGYIMAKMEGNSPQSPVVNNKVEYHIGGFSGSNSVLKNMGFLFPVPPLSKLDIRQGKISEIFINADFDKWWQGAYNLKIADNPVVTTPGTMAKNISNNYSNMFGIVDIKNY